MVVYEKITIQPNLNITKWAYFAGIIDGEGTIGFEKRYRLDKSFMFHPRISIDSITKELIDELHESFGGFKWNKANWVTKSGNPVYKIVWKRMNDLSMIMDNIKDYVIVKNNHVKLMNEFIKQRIDRASIIPAGDKRFGNPYNKRELEIINLIKEMNRRGKGNRANNKKSI